jgi:dihydrofolate reductase
MLKLIVCVRECDNAIGKGLDITYSFPSDLSNFKQVTLEQLVVMGRKTWDSLPFKPLPKRTNIIITRDKKLEIDGALVVRSRDEILKIAENTQQDLWIIGGAEIYKMFLPYVDEIHLTTANGDDHIPADIFMPNNFLNGFERFGGRQSFSEKNRMTGNLCSYTIETFRRTK